MTAIQKISQEAKRIYKANPQLTWRECIKKASLLYTKKKKNAIVKKVISIPAKAKKVAIKKAKAGAKSIIKKIYESKILNGTKAVAKKKATKKSVGYKDDRIEQLRKATPYIRKYTEKGFDRKEAIKNAMLDAGYLRGTKTHKDTKSHNVNIRVMSGLDKDLEKKLRDAIHFQGVFKSNIEFYKLMIKKEPKKKAYYNIKLKLEKEKLAKANSIVSKLKKVN